MAAGQRGTRRTDARCVDILKQQQVDDNKKETKKFPRETTKRDEIAVCTHTHFEEKKFQKRRSQGHTCDVT